MKVLNKTLMVYGYRRIWIEVHVRQLIEILLFAQSNGIDYVGVGEMA